MDNWISVKDRLPDVGVIVLCVDVDGKQTVAEYSDFYRCFFSGQFMVKGITHWQPLPEPPKGE